MIPKSLDKINEPFPFILSRYQPIGMYLLSSYPHTYIDIELNLDLIIIHGRNNNKSIANALP